MAKVITKTADELFETDESVIDDLHHSSGVLVVLQNTEYKTNLNIVKDLGTALNYDETIFAYEEPGGKGGGGADLLPSLSDVILYSIAFIITKSAATFIAELTKDIYRNTLKKLFTARKGSYGDGKFVLKLTTSRGYVITYYFQKYLTEDEFIIAIKLVLDHFIKIEKNIDNIENYDFIYDRKANDWLPL